MKLNKKYCNLIDSDNGYDNQLLADCCENIADKFAIGFAIWCIDYTYHKSFDIWIKNDNLKIEKFTNKELLEMYKQEKGL